MEYIPIYYDTETTGIKAGKDRIIELAAYDSLRERTFCTFVNPECPIPPESTAITNITDEMVQGAPTIQEALRSFTAFCCETSKEPLPSHGSIIMIAHNNDAFDKLFLQAEFERAGLSMPAWTFFDSLKWARKYRSDLPRHNLQSLREVYGIEANQAHRALDDVFVLHKIFSRMIDDLPWKAILELVNRTAQIVRMPFGKYAGKMLSEVPKDYVEWLAKSGALDKKENANLKEAFQKLGYLGGAS